MKSQENKDTVDCRKIKHRKFLWFAWTAAYIDHQWFYEGKAYRRCLACDVPQILFGVRSGGFEDWRFGRPRD